MSERSGALSRVFARIRALLSADWSGQAGKRMRNTTTVISEFAEENNLRPHQVAEEAVTLGRRKLTGLANKEYAAALKDFAEAEDKKIDIEMKKRSLQIEIRRKEAETRKAEIENLNAELELVKKLREIGATIHRDNDGHLTILPVTRAFDYEGLAHRLLAQSKDIGGEGVSTSPDDIPEPG